ncbi:TPA: plasmid maintenance protein CcdB [Enterobacter hormaechei subsp. steigerwaltii]|uniref:CcdB family protein n=1 Tax=Enterobacter hormaechei TaxID=158836 RepID=UPI000791B0B3|nr:CcdB family protein [Enterobacter hormaechei]ELC6562252.1 CcdB family protein [Enterobacter hormaechei]MCR4242388.1 CcdB family protein [Enterobacter hormaechei]MCU2328754.1 CcdB family protein [Enterobacter hormaechei subsp. steigerwaltii]MDZ5681830.1 CcdB family protein [Enterobacter hormaechei]OUK80097.1 plasmid maintenance protein CcdB [Enterobacter hormaechei]
MLRQFNVYRNTSAATRDQLPYYMLIQDDYYEDLPTRVIVPLARNNRLPLWQSQLAPGINIEFKTFLIYSPMITNINNQKINPKDFVCNLRNARQDVIAAIDRLLTNT